MRTKAEHDFIRENLPADLRHLYDEATRHLEAKRAKPIQQPRHGLVTGELAISKREADGIPFGRFAIVLSDSEFLLAETQAEALEWAGREHELRTAYPI